MRSATVATAILFVAAVTSTVAQSPPQGVTAFVNVNLISMERDGVDTGQTVIVQGDRIIAIGVSTPPTGAVVIDGTGRYLLPGLTDSHVHLTTDMPWAPARADFGDAPLYLAHGVTTVVNLRGTPAQLDWKRRIASGDLLGPTIYTSGEFVNEPRVRTPDDVEREVSAQARQGYDLIKFHEIWEPEAGFVTRRGLDRASYVRMFDAARKAGLQVVGHAPVNLGPDGLLAASGGAVAHVGELVRLYIRPPFWTLLTATATTAILLLIVASWVVTALVRRRRGTSLKSNTLARAKVLVGTVLIVFLVTFVAGALVGPGGWFYRSAGWRLGTTALIAGLAVVAVLAVVATLHVWRDRTISIRSRQSVLLAALAILVLVNIPILYWIPAIWKVSDASLARMATQLRDAGISVQTTLVVYEIGFQAADTSARVFADPSFASLAPQTQVLWRRFAGRPRPGVFAALLDAPPRYAEFTRAIAGALHRNGVQLLAGTDAMGLPMSVPGSSLHRELYLLTESGLTPYEALRTATVNPARFLGKEREFGTIAVGKRADLVLVERNPLENLSALNQPAGVMVRGRWLPRERLQELLSALR